VRVERRKPAFRDARGVITDGRPVEQRVLKAGDLWITPPRARHAILALEEGTFVACARGPRAGKDYENDTYRLPVSLVARRG